MKQVFSRIMVFKLVVDEDIVSAALACGPQHNRSVKEMSAFYDELNAAML